MLTLTTPVSVPNLTKCRVKAVRLDQDSSTAFVDVEVGGAAGRIYATLSLAIRNGLCDAIVRTSSPSGWNDLYGFGPQVTLATGFTDFVAAYTGAIAAKNKNAETWMSDPTRALLEAGTVA